MKLDTIETFLLKLLDPDTINLQIKLFFHKTS